MHPWRGRARPAQQDLPLKDPETVIGERHPQMVACETFLGRPLRRFQSVQVPDGPSQSRWGERWASYFDEHPEFGEVVRQGRSYLDNGLVWHLDIDRGEIRCIVLGSQLFAQHISIPTLSQTDEADLIEACSGLVSDTASLKDGQLPEPLLDRLARPSDGLFPAPGSIRYRCSCTEPKTVPCKHIGAALAAVGARLSERPQELFLMRGTDPEVLKGLLPTGLTQGPIGASEFLSEEELHQVFDLRLERPVVQVEMANAGASNDVDPLDALLNPDAAREAPPAPSPEPEETLPPPPAAAAGSWLDDDWEDAEDEDYEADDRAPVFGGSVSPVSEVSEGGDDLLEIGRADLLELGIRSHRIQKWLSEGTLLRTAKRGQYQMTPEAWAEIEPLLPTG